MFRRFREARLRRKLRKQVACGDMSINEARAAMGLPPLEPMSGFLAVLNWDVADPSPS